MRLLRALLLVELGFWAPASIVKRAWPFRGDVAACGGIAIGSTSADALAQ